MEYQKDMLQRELQELTEKMAKELGIGSANNLLVEQLLANQTRYGNESIFKEAKTKSGARYCIVVSEVNSLHDTIIQAQTDYERSS